jgi:hypothetical protein
VDTTRPSAAADDVVVSQPQRPLWLVALLTFSTFGAYTPIWLGVTWAELKRALRDDNMHPFWHALACLVPIYGLLKFCEHYTEIASLAERAGHRMRISPVAATVLAVFTTLYGGDTSAIPPGVLLVLLLLWLVAAAVRAWVMVEGQAALNAYWRSATTGEPRERIAWWEWGLLIVGAIWFVLVVVGFLAPA